MPLRVVFADDNFLVRQGTAALLAEAGNIDVVGLAEDVAGLLRVVAEKAPDAVLTDIRMPPTFTDEGLRAAKQIRRLHPGTGVVVLSQYAAPADVIELFSEGVEGLGYLLKERVARVEEPGRGAASGVRRWFVTRPVGGAGTRLHANGSTAVAPGDARLIES